MPTAVLLKYVLIGSVAFFVMIVIAYFSLMKKLDGGDKKYAKQLKAGTQTSKLSMEVLYMKLYI